MVLITTPPLRARVGAGLQPGIFLSLCAPRSNAHPRRDSTFISNAELVFPVGARYIVPALFSPRPTIDFPIQSNKSANKTNLIQKEIMLPTQMDFLFGTNRHCGLSKVLFFTRILRLCAIRILGASLLGVVS
jgi:hypothetical protein